MHYFGTGYGGLPFLPPVVGVALVALVLWSIVWKGLALWRAAKRHDKLWFVVFLVVNTAGILEIVYLFFVTGAKLSDFAMSEHKEHEHTHHH